MMKHTFYITILALSLTVLAGCRGMESKRPPIHISPNMDNQEKFVGQEANPFFEDGRAMRPPVPGTIARGFLREDTRFYFGRDDDGNFVQSMPVPVTRELLERGQERYNIYCTVCHGVTGDGQGIVMVGNGGAGYGFVQAPDYHADLLRDIEDGYLFDVISNGVRTMPGYGTQIPVADRWAIVGYIRALQRSQNADQGDLPPSELARIGQQAGGG